MKRLAVWKHNQAMTNVSKLPMTICSLLACLLVVPHPLESQLLYNSAKDAKAQDALKAAQDVTSGQVFEKMITNLDQLSKSSSERFFNDAERVMRANNNSFITWNDIGTYTDKLAVRLQLDSPGDATPAQISSALDDVQKKTNDAQKALQALQAAAQAKFSAPQDVALIGTWFGRLGKLGDFIQFVQTFHNTEVPPGFLDAATEAASLAASLGKMYANFTVALADTPDMVILDTQLQLLAANEEHLTQMAKIITQGETDLADTWHIIHQVKAQIAIVRSAGVINQDIADSLAAQLSAPGADLAQLRRMLSLLFNSAALAARDTTAKRLVSLRLADEERRYSIRSSAIAAGSYEVLVSSGVQRLANYYKGGIKLESLAQIATSLATLGLIPTIAVK